MAYLEFEIPVLSWSSTEKEILFARMGEVGFEGFAEGEEQIQAYIKEEVYSSENMNQVIDELADSGIHVQYRYHLKNDQNWNEEWEKKFDPVLINERVLIRAPFHSSDNDRDITLLIEPKMSFGTGHHFTTRLMLQEMDRMDLREASVLDMGCGTGVLGIFACHKGATRVLGIDNDQWAYENALENRDRNNAGLMEIRLSDASSLGDECFDLVLANITRNTLVKDMEAYANSLNSGGSLLLSGFLAEDVLYVLNEAYRCGVKHLKTSEEASWISALFIKEESS